MSDFWLGVLTAYALLGFIGGITWVVIFVWLWIAVRA